MQHSVSNSSSRRQFVRRIAGSSVALASANALFAQKKRRIPIGLELYSVRHDLEKDEMGTLQNVAQLGYQCVEFFAPYYSWTPEHAKAVRAKLDELKIHCYSTHNGYDSFTSSGVQKAIELNQILGTRFIVMSSTGRELTTADEWKKVAETLNTANERMASSGLHAGYHNHDAEWKPVEGQKPMEILAKNTDKSIMLQLDVGTCVEAGSDPVAWIEQNPGRIRSLHLKDWAPQQGYKVLFGEGVCPWTKIFEAAETKGGVEYYLIEQEGSRYPELETVKRCLANYKTLRSGGKVSA